MLTGEATAVKKRNKHRKRERTHTDRDFMLPAKK